jgi:hypothetical protein
VPNEIKVEFELKLSTEAGAIVAASGIEANYKVTLKWKRKENEVCLKVGLKESIIT